MKAHFKKILIISDNVFLCKQLSNILDETIENNAFDSTYKFACSIYSNHKEFEETLNSPILVLDLKVEKNVLSLAEYDLILSIHCKQLFPDSLLNSAKCINIHPGYNPITKGWYPQIFSIIHGLQLGATIHEMTADLDDGPIIDRIGVESEASDNSLTAYNRVLEAEIKLFRDNIPHIISNEYKTFIPSEEGNLFLKKHFKAMQEIDLSEILTFKEAIDRLRAFTHPPFSNIYFIDDNGVKNYIEIKITKNGS